MVSLRRPVGSQCADGPVQHGVHLFFFSLLLSLSLLASLPVEVFQFYNSLLLDFTISETHCIYLLKDMFSFFCKAVFRGKILAV